MANETHYQYLGTMDPADEQHLFNELSAIGNERAIHEAKGVELTERAQQAAKKALEQGMKPSRIARALHYTDGYIRKLRLEADLPPDPRYAGNTPPSRRKTEPVPDPEPAPLMPEPPIRSMIRADELRAIAGDLSDADAVRIADELAVKHARLLTIGKTQWETIDNAIRANLVTTSDLR